MSAKRRLMRRQQKKARASPIQTFYVLKKDGTAQHAKIYTSEVAAGAMIKLYDAVSGEPISHEELGAGVFFPDAKTALEYGRTGKAPEALQLAQGKEFDT